MSLSAGARLGTYEVLGALGAGGMGEVYRARDPRLRRDVAIKVLPAHLSADHERRRRFEVEARALSRLNHPNVLTVHDVGEDGGLAWIAMELVDGVSLRERIASGPVGAGEALDIAVQLATALEAAHGHGIVHRDLKPGNVMLRSDGIVKVVDFGLARSLDSPPAALDSLAPTESFHGTTPGTLLGTTAYMSPEQARGEATDARTDQFSFGAVLYEMLSGRRAFTGATGADTLAAVLTSQPAPLAEIDPSIPDGLIRVVDRCLAKEPSRRYATTAELAAEVRRLRDTTARSAPAADPPAARTSTRGRDGGGDRRRLALPLALALAVLALALAAAVIGLPKLRRTPGTVSLAVLPFSTSAAGPDAEVLSDGLTEGLINALSRRPGLKVTARTTAARYKGRDADPLSIARELGVAVALSGHVIERAGRIAVQADLLDVRDGVQLWGDRFERAASELGVVQAEIAAAVAERLRPEAAPPVTAAASTTTDPEAQKLHLKGRHFLNRRDARSVALAIDYFKQASARDPRWAPPFAGLAAAYDVQAYSHMVPRDEGFVRARAAAARALELDPSHPEALAVRAHVKMNHENDPRGAEGDFRRALEVDPGCIDARHWYSHLLMNEGRFEESLVQSEAALELDPLSPFITAHLGEHHVVAREPSRALEPLRKAIELDPDYAYGHRTLGLALIALERYGEAVVSLRRAVELRGSDTLALGSLGQALARAGAVEDARGVLAALEDPARRPPSSPADVALVEMGLGQEERAVQRLQRGLAEGTVTERELWPPGFDAVRARLGLAPGHRGGL